MEATLKAITTPVEFSSVFPGVWGLICSISDLHTLASMFSSIAGIAFLCVVLCLIEEGYIWRILYGIGFSLVINYICGMIGLGIKFNFIEAFIIGVFKIPGFIVALILAILF